MSSYRKEDLSILAKRAEEIESYLIRVLEEKGAKQNHYASLEEFLQEN